MTDDKPTCPTCESDDPLIRYIPCFDELPTKVDSFHDDKPTCKRPLVPCMDDDCTKSHILAHEGDKPTGTLTDEQIFDAYADEPDFIDDEGVFDYTRFAKVIEAIVRKDVECREIHGLAAIRTEEYERGCKDERERCKSGGNHD